MTGLDDAINLANGRRQPTTLRRLAGEGRLFLRKSGSYRGSGATEPRKAFWADITRPGDPGVTEGFEITAATYDELREMGVQEVSAE